MVSFYNGFLCGMLVVLLFNMIGNFFRRRLSDRYKKTNDELVQLGEKCDDSCKPAPLQSLIDLSNKELRVLNTKMNRLADIGERIGVLNIALSQPSKNQLHSLYKNKLINEARALDDEKDKIVQELIDSGINPMITVREDEDTTTRISLRQFLSEIQDRKEAPKKPEKKKHLTLIKDEEQDDD